MGIPLFVRVQNCRQLKWTYVVAWLTNAIKYYADIKIIMWNNVKDPGEMFILKSKSGYKIICIVQTALV